MLNKLGKIKLNADHKSILSDLFVDLAAGWIGGIFLNNQATLSILTLNITLAILSLYLAYEFKRH